MYSPFVCADRGFSFPLNKVCQMYGFNDNQVSTTKYGKLMGYCSSTWLWGPSEMVVLLKGSELKGGFLKQWLHFLQQMVSENCEDGYNLDMPQMMGAFVGIPLQFGSEFYYIGMFQ